MMILPAVTITIFAIKLFDNSGGHVSNRRPPARYSFSQEPEQENEMGIIYYYNDLTPLVPLSLKGEGEIWLEGLCPSKTPLLWQGGLTASE